MLKKIIPLVVVFLIVSCSEKDPYPGYRLIEKRFVKEVNADCYFLEHIKTGAKVFKIAADDPNKTFAINFKTLPENNGGTPHILEHSVLNGSKHFPSKSPFDVLSKGSLKTFLNAMTSMDHTMYPAASVNEKDYFNLMHVYYDAVFFPLIYERPEIFQQEGWHRELLSEDGDITYKGVVYNEMKGAFSSPEREMFNEVKKELFAGSPYGYSSGGYPDDIPKLTYESFLAFHKKYYHPSNSYIFFYGDADLKDELTFIDTAYLSKFDKSEINSDIPMLESPFSETKFKTAQYSIPEGVPTEDQTYVSLNYVIGDGTDLVQALALDVLNDVLFNLESAPVRLALQEAGLGSNVDAWSYQIRQNFEQITVYNTNPEDAQAIKDLVYSTLQKVVDEGLDSGMVEGVLNRMEFSLRENNDANIGITLMSRVFSNWIHSQDPFAAIEYEKTLAGVKEELKTNYLTDLIKNAIIDNPFSLVLTMEPKAGLETEKTLKLREELKEYKESLSEDQIKELIASTNNLIEEQEREDSPEVLATIPMLTLADINKEAEHYEIDKTKVDNNTVLHYDAFTNSVVYLRYYFNAQVLDQEMIPYLSIYSVLFGKLGTENYSYEELEKILKLKTGGFGSNIAVQNNYKQPDEYKPQFQFFAKTTSDKVDDMMKLSEEVLLKTDFSDIARIKNILTKHLANVEGAVKGNGFGYTRKRLYSYLTPGGIIEEETSGIDYYWFLADLVQNFDSKADDLIAKMKEINKDLITRNNFDVGVICNSEDYEDFSPLLAASLNNYPENDVEVKDWTINVENKQEGFMAASKVQYVLQGADYNELGQEYNGKLEVLNKVLRADYLQKEVRIKGGAYGGFAYFLNDGRVFFGSYRDPNLKETLDAFAGAPEFIANYTSDSLEFVRSIIGTISSLDRPMTPQDEGELAINRYYNGYTNEKAQKVRDEVLSTTIDDIRSFAPLIENVLNQDIYCVYGNQKKVEENKDLFKTVETVVR